MYLTTLTRWTCYVRTFKVQPIKTQKKKKKNFFLKKFIRPVMVYKSNYQMIKVPRRYKSNTARIHNMQIQLESKC